MARKPTPVELLAEEPLPPGIPPGAERYAQYVHRDLLRMLMEVPRFDFDRAWAFYRAFEHQCEEIEAKYPDRNRTARAFLGCIDRYYLLVFLLNRQDLLKHGWEEQGVWPGDGYQPAGNRWLYERCREVEASPDGRIDLWSRESYKSSIITFGGIIQEVLRNPEITIAIFSVTRKEAKKHLRPIKIAFETNTKLISTYRDVLWDKPDKEAPKWSENEGVIVRRKGNPKESTIEAWGLIDAMPTGSHYDLRVYDDVVTERHSSNPEMVAKAIEAFDLSDNLGKKGGRIWVIGTRYSFADPYQTFIDRKILVPRLYPATEDGTPNARPVFLSAREWEHKKASQPTTYAAQMLQNPAAGHEAMFRAVWLRPFEVRPETLHVYILVDPSKGDSQRSDRTAMAVVGVDGRENKYLLDGVCHRMDLDERTEVLNLLYDKWRKMPGVQLCEIGYERYGHQTDKEHIESMARLRGKVLPIREVSWVRNSMKQSKPDRVERLVPDFKVGRFLIPMFANDAGRLVRWRVREDKVYWEPVQSDRTRLRADALARSRGDLVVGPIKKIDEKGRLYDLTMRFVEEYLYFPFGRHKDLVDAVSRIYDMDPTGPMIVRLEDIEPPVFVDS